MSTPMPPKSVRVLAVDPGYERLGIAVVEKIPATKEKLIYSECFKTSPKATHAERLHALGNHIKEVIEEYSPSCFAIETLFWGTNQKTGMKVSEARGALLYQATLAKLPVFEYSPSEIKIAVTGYGRSDKKQVIHMVERLLEIEKTIPFDDEYDAIAVALTCIARQKNF